jgi:hypothetical protein
MFGGRRHRAREGHAHVVAAALPGAPRAGAFHQDAPHDSRRDAEKVGAIAPIDARAEQTKIRLVHQDGGFDRMRGRIPAELSTREAPKLGVDERNHPVECGRVAGPPFAEQGFQRWFVHAGATRWAISHKMPGADLVIERGGGQAPLRSRPSR